MRYDFAMRVFGSATTQHGCRLSFLPKEALYAETKACGGGTPEVAEDSAISV